MNFLYNKKEEEERQISFIKGKINGIINFSRVNENKIIVIIDDRISIRNILKKEPQGMEIGITGKENMYDKRAKPTQLRVKFFRTCIYGKDICEVYIFLESEKDNETLEIDESTKCQNNEKKDFEIFLDFIYPEEVGELDIIKKDARRIKYL